MAHVTYQEKAFLQLVARRVLRYSREAADRGEEYHDLAPHAPLQCGVHAKYRFDAIPGGYRPVVAFKKAVAFGGAELEEIAAEILDAPARLSTASTDGLEYVRAVDAGTPVPG